MQLEGYDILAQIFESSNSIVFLARRLSDELPVIIKLLNRDYPTNREIARYRREYEITRGLDLEHTVRTYDLLPYRNSLAMILEDFGGTSVDRHLVARSFQVLDFLRLAIRVARILGGVHGRYIIHKDISPANIVWNPETDVVKLIDFGISTELSRENPRIMNPGAMEGTLFYIAPEQTGRMNRPVDYRSDLYSLGATFFHMLAGRPPFPLDDLSELIHSHIAREAPGLSEVNPSVPRIISDIVHRLMVKSAEERYQSARGVAGDLETCLVALEAGETEPDFAIARDFASDHFRIPEKLYGREVQQQELIDLFDRVREGERVLLLVSGYAGIGKTSLVGEAQRPIAETGGYFIAGKFDQFRRDVPYLAFLQAFKDMCRQILIENPERLEYWRGRLTEALEPNGAIIAELLPELTLITGEFPPPPPVGPEESRHRFDLVFRQFVSALTAEGHPLLLFLDDLQWADFASLKLIQSLLLDAEMSNLFVIGAYRDNEVDADHALSEIINVLYARGVRLSTMSLGPLDRSDVRRMTAETLRIDENSADDLARMLHERTEGNPFFAREFFQLLHHSGKVRFDPENASWSWDTRAIQSSGVTADIGDLMTRKIHRLSARGREVLQLAACIGNTFNLQTLAIAADRTNRETARELGEALKMELVLPIGNEYKYVENSPEENDTEHDAQYRFLHDRVQQAAYQLIAETERIRVHLRIGRYLQKRTPAEQLEEELFTIVDHLNLGVAFIQDATERSTLARLNARAGQKARRSAAHAAGARYFAAGIALLADDVWSVDYRLALDLYEGGAETEYLKSNFEVSDALIDEVIRNARGPLDMIPVYRTRILSLNARGRRRDSTLAGLEVLRKLGEPIPEHPRPIHVWLEDLRTRAASLIARVFPGRVISRSPTRIAATEIQAMMISGTYQYDHALFQIVSLRLGRRGLQNLPDNLAFFGLAAYGNLLCMRGQFERGFRLAQDSLALVEEHDASDIRPRCMFVMGGFVMHWVRPLPESFTLLRESARVCIEAGEIEFAGYSVYFRLVHEFWSVGSLDQLETELNRHLRFFQGFENQAVLALLGLQAQVVQNLRNTFSSPYLLRGDYYQDEQVLPILHEQDYSSAILLTHLHRAFLAYLFRDQPAALREIEATEAMIESVYGLFQHNILLFFQALILIEEFRRASGGERTRLMREIHRAVDRLHERTRANPAAFEAMVTLVEAELAGIQDDSSKAGELYESALARVEGNGDHIILALSEELAGRYYLRHRPRLALLHLAEARQAYERWGAAAKVKHLEEEFPDLVDLQRRLDAIRKQNPDPGNRTAQGSSTNSADTSTSTSEERDPGALDLQALLKASRAIAGEFYLPGLLKKLMTIVMENAGANRGFLLLESSDRQTWRIEAEGGPDEDSVRVNLGLPLAGNEDRLAASVVHYVLRTGETVVLENAADSGRFTRDPYVLARRSRSVFCTGLFHQKHLSAVLYLENDLMDGAFVSDRTEVIAMLSSQIAVSLKNARLYSEMQETIRRRDVLERTNLTQSEIIAKLNHELQIPMLGVLANLEMMEKAVKEGQIARVHSLIHKSVNYGLYQKTLIGNMVYASVADIRDPFYISRNERSSLRECFELTADLIKDIHDGSIATGLPPDVWIACQDEILMIVLINVIGNSAEHAGRVGLEWRVSSSECHLLCENEIDAPLDLEAIFMPWNSTRTGGAKLVLGIGLNIAREILHSLGGSIEAEQDENRFMLKLTLPLAEADD